MIVAYNLALIVTAAAVIPFAGRLASPRALVAGLALFGLASSRPTRHDRGLDRAVANAHLQRAAPVTRNECERALLLRPGGRYLTQ